MCGNLIRLKADIETWLGVQAVPHIDYILEIMTMQINSDFVSDLVSGQTNKMLSYMKPQYQIEIQKLTLREQWSGRTMYFWRFNLE